MLREGPVFEAGDAPSGDVGNPDRAVRANRQPAQPHDRAVERKPRDFARGADVHDGPALDVGIPGAAVAGDRQAQRFEIAPGRPQQVNTAAADAPDAFGLIDGEPDRAVRGRGDRHRRIMRVRHGVLDDPHRRRSAPHQQRAAYDQHDDCKGEQQSPTGAATPAVVSQLLLT